MTLRSDGTVTSREARTAAGREGVARETIETRTPRCPAWRSPDGPGPPARWIWAKPISGVPGRE